jgi:hypothetical protein
VLDKSGRVKARSDINDVDKLVLTRGRVSAAVEIVLFHLCTCSDSASAGRRSIIASSSLKMIALCYLSVAAEKICPLLSTIGPA